MNFGYFNSGGNLLLMQIKNLGIGLFWAIAKVGLWFGLPAYFAWQQWQQGQNNRVFIGAAVWVVILLVALPSLRKWLDIGREVDEFAVSLQEQAGLFGKMAKAYNSISPTAPPGFVRRTLEEVGRDGAVWDGRSISLLVKAERRDPVSWSRDYRNAWIRPLGRNILDKLTSLYHDKRTEGVEMEEPDYDGELPSLT